MTEDADRVLPATPRRREEARNRGMVARSADLAGALVLLVGIVALAIFGGRAMESALRMIRESLGSIGTMQPEGLGGFFASLLAAAGLSVLPIVTIVMFASVAANLFQVGFLFRPVAFGFSGKR